MFPSRISSAIALVVAASFMTGCMTNDRYQYTNKKRYKRTSIGRQAPKPQPEEQLQLITPPSAPAAPQTAPPPAPPAGSDAMPVQ